MPYCVHCGVELHPHVAACPLCQTPIHDPNAADSGAPSNPYPTTRKEVPPVSKREAALLISAMLGSVAVAVSLLNLFVGTGNFWSFYVSGAAVVLWFFLVPPLIWRHLHISLRLFLGCFSVGLYLALIALELKQYDWLRGLALPILAVACALLMLLGWLFHGDRRSYLTRICVIIGALGLFTVCVEFLTDRFLQLPAHIGWSLIVVIICIALIAPLLVVRFRPSLREEVRRRTHR